MSLAIARSICSRKTWRPSTRRLSTFVYEYVNNGVYKAGFATKQRAYEKACRVLFAALDELEARLSTRRYLIGNRIVEADWRLFCTLVRFDAVYHGHFKCNVRRIVDYPNLDAYLRDLYQQPGIAETVNFDHIKRHYYITHDDINPTPHCSDRSGAGSYPAARSRTVLEVKSNIAGPLMRPSWLGA